MTDGKELPRALVIGALPPPPGGVGILVRAILDSPLSERWRLEPFNLSKPQQEGKPSTVTPWDVVWTLVHLVRLPWVLLVRRPRVALVQSTADTGFLRDLALVLVCRAFRVPVVLQWHGYPEAVQFPGPRADGWRGALFRFGARRAARFIVLADPYAPFFEPLVPRGRLVVIPNFTNGEVFRPSPRAATPSTGNDGSVRVLFVGRVGPAKGTDLLLEAIAHTSAAASAPRIVGTLVGAGETPEAFEAAAAHPLVRAGTVELRGPLGEERLREYASADVFVLPTLADSFPVVILEAMATGLPVIASRLGAIPWILEDGAAGVLVPAGDGEALAEALGRLAASPEDRRRLGARARERQQASFDVKGAVVRLDRTLAEAAGRG
ncbi:MAG: glycosyltransferase family 4 protein [Candidatus Eiseniibacteriota bacterium]